MRTYKAAYTKPITIKFDEDTKNKLEKLATEANISQGEFVRDAVEHYIKHLNNKETNEEYYAYMIGAKTDNT